VEALAYAEGEVLDVHPFEASNGRATRVVLIEVLGRLDLPPVRWRLSEAAADLPRT